jgi:hypothetical protein
MAKNTSPDQPECINGWIEILHFKWEIKNFHKARPLIVCSDSLERFKEEHYDLVGSPIPLCEYDSVFELYQQYALSGDPEFKIPRPFRLFDAINLCMNDAKHGRKVITFMVWEKGNWGGGPKFKTGNAHYHRGFPCYLIQRQQPFGAFFPRMRQADGEIQD